MPEQPFGQEDVPPQQDTIQSHTPGQTQISENVFEKYSPAIAEVDSTHEALAMQSRHISALMARLARYENPEQVVSAPAGGEPVPHHLHLVDGRVVAGHGGIATHYSETLPDGTTKVTRVKEYYPVNEPDPSTLNA